MKTPSDSATDLLEFEERSTKPNPGCHTTVPIPVSTAPNRSIQANDILTAIPV